MEIDDALAQRAGGRLGALEGNQATGRIALHGEDGMRHEADIDAEIGQLGQDRIDQERHVVVDDLEHRLVAQPLMAHREVGRLKADFRRTWFAHREQRPGVGGKLGELAGIVAQKVFGQRVSEQAGEEIGGNLRMGATQNVGRSRDQCRFGTLLIDPGAIDS
jgi:hypothetical protein